MLKNILKVFGICLLVIFVIFNTYALIVLSHNVAILFTNLQLQINNLETENLQLHKINDTLFDNDIKTLKASIEFADEVIKYTKNSDNQLKHIENKIKDVNKDLILNGSVFVQGVEGTGSGTVVKKTKNSLYILTCYHVIASNYETQMNGKSLGVIIGYYKQNENGKEAGLVEYGAEIIKADKENDLALLKTEYADESLNEIKLAEVSPIKGEIVYSVGHPLDLKRAISKGILTAFTEGFYVTDNTITFGNSGGGLFNINGELIGVPAQVTGYGNSIFGTVPESSLGFSINILRIKSFLNGEL